jgi:hypothetical protein
MRGGCGRFGGFFPLGLQGLTLHLAHFLLKGAFEIGGGFAELRHQFAKAAREFGQLLGPENDEDHHKQNDHVGHAKHGIE